VVSSLKHFDRNFCTFPISTTSATFKSHLKSDFPNTVLKFSSVLQASFPYQISLLNSCDRFKFFTALNIHVAVFWVVAQVLKCNIGQVFRLFTLYRHWIDLIVKKLKNLSLFMCEKNVICYVWEVISRLLHRLSCRTTASVGSVLILCIFSSLGYQSIELFEPVTFLIPPVHCQSEQFIAINIQVYLHSWTMLFGYWPKHGLLSEYEDLWVVVSYR
jgi:hypothetical protein